MRIFAWLLALICLLGSAAGAEEGTGKSTYRFAFMGCNRVGFEVDLAKNPSTANLEQLRNTLSELHKKDPQPEYLFFIGDLVLGYTNYLTTVHQLRSWKAEFERSALARSKTTLVPVMGNHEALLSYQDREKVWHDYPNPPAVTAWRDQMRPYLRWKDGPTALPPNLDSLTSTQEDLSFTIKDGGVLFIMLNTDTFVDNITTGDIPLNWLGQKLAEGQADTEIEHIFVMGHKPLIKPGLDAYIVRDEEIQPALDLINQTPKVRAFLTSHYHLWDFREMPGGVPQIIAGNGGSLLKGPFADRSVGYYGYTVIDILDSGEISVESWGRPIPEPYWSEERQPRATLRERHIISPKRN